MSQICAPPMVRGWLTPCCEHRNFPTAVAPVTKALGGLTEQRQHCSGVVRRGAVDTTAGCTRHSPATHHHEIHPRDNA